MQSKFSSLVLLAGLLALPLAAGCQAPERVSDRGAVRDGVFIHLSKGAENAHAVVMALKMANLMAKDRDVLVYCDLQGINAVLKDGPEITFPTFDPARTQVQALLDQSVPVYACPGCMKALGKTPADLLPGVRVADKEAFFTFTRGRILMLDY